MNNIWRLKITYRDQYEINPIEEEFFFEDLEQAMAYALEYRDNVEEVIHVDINKIYFAVYKEERVLNAKKELNIDGE